MTAKYRKGFVQMDSVEREEYAKVPSASPGEGKERDGAENLLKRILDRNNLNRAYKQVKRNHGAPGIDGMTVEQALPWLQEHRAELLQSITHPRCGERKFLNQMEACASWVSQRW